MVTDLQAAAATFAVTLDTVEAAELPALDLTEKQGTVCRVLTKSDRAEIITRTKDQHDYDIQIGVQRKFSSATADLKPMKQTTRQIRDYFIRRTLTDFPLAKCTGGQIDPIVHPTHWLMELQFTSVITLTYRTIE